MRGCKSGLPLPQRFPASVLIGLINRHAAKPAVLGLINPNDALWLITAQQDGGIPINDTVQTLSSLADLTAIALSQGAHTLAKSCTPQISALL